MPMTGHLFEHARQLLGVVQLDERLKAEFEGLPVQSREPVVRQALRDQQDRVGPGGPGFEQLVAVEDEVLAEHGARDRAANRREVVEAALKEVRRPSAR